MKMVIASTVMLFVTLGRSICLADGPTLSQAKPGRWTVQGETLKCLDGKGKTLRAIKATGQLSWSINRAHWDPSGHESLVFSLAEGGRGTVVFHSASGDRTS